MDSCVDYQQWLQVTSALLLASMLVVCLWWRKMRSRHNKLVAEYLRYIILSSIYHHGNIIQRMQELTAVAPKVP